MAHRYLEMRKYVAPEFIFGCGALQYSGLYARNLGSEKALIVTDPGIIEAGWLKELEKCLGEAGIEYAVFSGVTPNPRCEEVHEGIEVFRREKCSFFIAIGGGSPMDCAKGISILSSNEGQITDFQGVDKINNPNPPLICIPTTAGSASEVSQFSIIYDVAKKVKFAIISKAVIPDLALIDPILTTTMDAGLTACTGMDALTHAIESYVSNASSFMSEMTSIESIRLINDNLVSAIKNPREIKYRSLMLRASLLAGLAFSNSSLGLVHGMAHALGGMTDMPHGLANLILLEKVIAYNFDAAPDKYSEVANALGIFTRGMTDAMVCDYLCERICNMKESAGISRSLGQMNVSRDDIRELALKAIDDPCLATNPRKPNLEDIESIYGRAF